MIKFPSPAVYQMSRLRNRINSVRREVADAVAKAISFKERVFELGQERDDLRRLHAQGLTDRSSTVLSYVVIFWVFGVLVLDATLLRPTAEYILNMTGVEQHRNLLVLVLAGAVVVVDIAWGKIVSASLDELRLGRGAGWAICALAGALAWACVMPILADAALTAASSADAISDYAAVFTKQRWGVILVAALSHGSLVFGGRWLFAGLEYLQFRYRDAVFAGKLRDAREAFAAVATEALRLHAECQHDIDAFNRAYPGDRLAPAMADSLIAQLRADFDIDPNDETTQESSVPGAETVVPLQHRTS